MRTFRFTSEGSVANTQTQTVECDIHLEPVSDISTEQPNDCTCYSEEQCKGKHSSKIDENQGSESIFDKYFERMFSGKIICHKSKIALNYIR